MMDTGSRLISLNLVYDYPVRWSRYPENPLFGEEIWRSENGAVSL